VNNFKVLAIDGGGIKGLYSAMILSLFENSIRKERGDDERIVDYTDLICGTSTGGLIALALALRVPTETICKFYLKHGPHIFKGSQGLFALLRQTLFRGKFSDKPLRHALEEMFQDHKIGDSQCLLCIPSYDYTHGTYGVFKFDHLEGKLCRHNLLSMVDVGLATSAAPTYFPLAQIELENSTQYVDGGVWANNPSMVGFVEAMRYFVGPGKTYDHLTLLSVASLNVGSGKPPLLRRRRSFIRWAPDLFNLSLIGQSEFTDIFLSLAQKESAFPMSYIRIPSPLISSEQIRYIKLDYAHPRSFALIRQFATDMYHRVRLNSDTEKFFTERKTYYTINRC
jgi:uncharacterized protein